MQYSVWYQTEGYGPQTNLHPTTLFEPYFMALPDGMDYMRDVIKLPVTSHNRFWYDIHLCMS